MNRFHPYSMCKEKGLNMRCYQKNVGRLAVAAVLCFAATGLISVWGQGERDKVVKIRRIDGDEVRTPEYRIIGGTAQGQKREWFEASCEYETYPEWIDELRIRYYMLVKSKEGRSRLTLFSGEIIYVDIEEGNRHKSVAYLHPSTLARYGEVQAIAVVIYEQGRPVAMESRPASKKRWWENYTPVKGYVRNRMETPFAMINFDDYEAIKAGSNP
jgi:hypothetical protein